MEIRTCIAYAAEMTRERGIEVGRGARQTYSSEVTSDFGYAMKHEALLDRITTDPNICFGKPCIRGHRIWVSLVLDLLADGLSVADVLEQYPELVEDDIRACIAYAAEMTRERLVDPKRRGAA